MYQCTFLNSKRENSFVLMLHDCYFKKLMKIIISLIILVKVPVGGYCKVDEQCHGNNHSGVCQLGKCVCKDGYVLYNLECHEGKLEMLFKKY